MKITCNREKMLHAFQTVAAIAPARSPKPILQNVKLEAAGDKATLMATDLEVGIRYEVTGVETDTPGAAVLPVARFGSILRESTDATFRIEAGSEGTQIRGERSQFKLPSENPQDFPPIAEFGESSYYEVSARLFRDVAAQVLVGSEQNLTILRDRVHDLFGVARGDDVVAVRLHLGRAVDVADRDCFRKARAPGSKTLARTAVGERTTGLHVRHQDDAFGVQNLGRLRHEVNTGEQDHVGSCALCGLRELKRVADEIGQLLNFAFLVIVGEQDGVALAFEAADFLV